MEFEEALVKGFGVVSARQLKSAGYSDADVRRAVRNGELRSLRRGWYATESADPDAVAAVARGGVLSCVSALAKHGVWIPEGLSDRLHTRCTPAMANRRGRAGYCCPYGDLESAVFAVDEVPAAFRHALRCLDEEALVVVCDSIRNLGLLDLDDLRHEARSAPSAVRARLDLSALAESGTETMTRLRLRSRRIKAVPQVEIPGIGRVDFLIGDRLIVEVDGREFHSDRFEEDRNRDLEANRIGYRVLRLSYLQVVHFWERCEATLLAMIRRREHLGPLTPDLVGEPVLDC